MAELNKLDSKIEVKAGADKLLEFFSSKLPQLPKLCPKIVQRVDLVEGDDLVKGTVQRVGLGDRDDLVKGTVQGDLAKGVIIIVIIDCEDKKPTSNKIVPVIDKKNKRIIFEVIEGDLLARYKSFKFIFEVTPRDNGSVVTWTLECQKLNENVRDPTGILKWAAKVTNAVDDGIFNN